VRSRPVIGQSWMGASSLTTNALSRVILGLASTAIIAGLVIWTWLDFADVRGDGEARVSAAAAAMSDLARSSLATIDRVIESVVDRINGIGLDGLASESEKVRLRRFANNLPETGTLLIFDKAGDAVAAAPLVLPAPLHVGDREWFRAVHDETVGIYVGRALKSRAFHDLVFPCGLNPGTRGYLRGCRECSVRNGLPCASLS
jgi:hypothetical protein